MSGSSGPFVVGVDIGGTHVTAAVVDAPRERILDDSRVRLEVDSGAAAGAILDRWTQAIRRAMAAAGAPCVSGIGLAMPGPFDYPRGISALHGLGKFDALFGVNVRQALLGTLQLDLDSQIIFRNDAQCFALGEAWLGAGRGAQRVVAITLGTGLGSAFIRDGLTVSEGSDVPESGWLYCVPFEAAMAEEHFSSRGLLRRFRQRAGRAVDSVAELARRAPEDADALATFEEFGRRLGTFLLPWLRRFKADRLIVGGSIAQAWDLFAAPLREACQGVDARPAALFEDAAIAGAARVAQLRDHRTIDESARIRAGRWRRSAQRLMPLHKPPAKPGQYDLYPASDVGAGRIDAGFEALAAAIAGQRRIAIDGYVGVFFDDFRRRLDVALRRRGIAPLWYEARAALKPEAQISRLIEPFLGGDDPLFGTRFTGVLDELFNPEALARIRPDEQAAMCILIGPGAALARWEGPLLYLDLPKNELQFRARAGSVSNLGAAGPASPKQMYKRFYFVDWILLNGHKRTVLPRIDLLIDTQRPDEPAFISGAHLRDALDALSTHAFRVRPWFEPGPWGGQWMKEHFGDLPADEPNYAWSFELIVPENGLILHSSGALLEITFDWLMYAHAERVIGQSFGFFGCEFPIRFDYLDTVRGGNLSVQCHPRPQYIRRQFGERFTQDETYYIHHAERDARVYLGFRDGIDPAEFRALLERSAREGVEVDIDRYVGSWPARKHDLFLIPHGTIHCSGVGNLVLEISATPYIFTFKMYDWMRLDLDGAPRSLNIARAFDNLNFDRAGERVRSELIAQPREAGSGDGWRIVHLPTHQDHFYDVRRYEFSRTLDVETGGSCHVGNLVEGSEILVQTRDTRLRIAYGETFVVPAAAEHYTLINGAGGEAKVVVAYVKPGYAFPALDGLGAVTAASSGAGRPGPDGT